MSVDPEYVFEDYWKARQLIENEFRQMERQLLADGYKLVGVIGDCYYYEKEDCNGKEESTHTAETKTEDHTEGDSSSGDS